MTRLDSPVSSTNERTACASCNQELPLRLSMRGEEAGLWTCRACERPFAGVYVRNAPAHFASRVRFADTHFDASESAPVPAAMIATATEFANRTREAFDRPERRSEQRRMYGLEAVVVELDSLFCPKSQPANVYVHNLSSPGLGFVGGEMLRLKWLVIEMARSGVRVQLIAEVVHCQSTGTGFYQAGVKFLLRLG